MQKMGMRATFAVAAVAMGSVAFAGSAMATDGYTHGSGGSGGNGGAANANCAIPIGVSAGVLGQGGPIKQCNATGGAAGNGGSGVSY
ncbi:MAG TPA: hypothetical protein VGH89_18160 [Pseudonocardia sp.]|jgi:hypothetical protein